MQRSDCNPSDEGRRQRILCRLEAGDVVATIYEGDFAGEAPGGAGGGGGGGGGVDTDLFCAEVGGKVADGGFERGLCDAHDVVVWEDLFCAVVGEGEDGAALGHERFC